MSAGRPASPAPKVRRRGDASRDPSGLLRFTFDVLAADGRRVLAAVLCNRRGLLFDLQAEGPAGFTAGTAGDPAADQAIADDLAAFLGGSRSYHAVAATRREARP